jgi:hypothetical protein
LIMLLNKCYIGQGLHQQIKSSVVK